jgi:hypothetical protein
MGWLDKLRPNSDANIFLKGAGRVFTLHRRLSVQARLNVIWRSLF